MVVLSHGFWQTRFSGSRDVVGQTIVLNGTAFTVVGVGPERFAGLMTPLAAALWVPSAADALLRPMLDEAARLNRSALLVGRLKPGVGLAQAQADLDTIGRQLRLDAGEPAREQAAVTVYPATAIHPEFMQPLSVMLGGLMALMVLVLGIVCVNVANLVLARAAGRGPELAIRQSLGAPRRRLIRQLLTENGILAAAGVLGGAGDRVLGHAGADGAVQLPTPIPVAFDVSLDWRVFLFTALIGAGATLGFGAAPAFAATRRRPRRRGQGTPLGPGPRQPAAIDLPDRAGGDVGPAAGGRGPVHSQREERHARSIRVSTPPTWWSARSTWRRAAIRRRGARSFSARCTSVSMAPEDSPPRRWWTSSR